MTLRILGGQYKGRIIRSPKGLTTRPTQGVVRQALFNICQASIRGARFLDLFAGSGAMGLEALSRGAAEAVLIERDREAARCIRENIALLQLKTATLLHMELQAALKFLTKKRALFDLIYIDPPYGEPHLLIEVLRQVERAEILAPESLLFIETSSQEEELIYESDRLKKRDERRFGIARLYQFFGK